MANRQISKAATVLIKTREFLSDINNWCPETRGMNGYFQDAMTKQEQFCALRAVAEIMDRNEPPESATWQEVDAYNELRRYAVTCLSYAAARNFKCDTISSAGVIDVNRMGHESVLKLFDYAIDEEVRNVVQI
jgi:hypothetical protein